MSGPAFTDRTLPAPWGLCDVCGKAAGLPLPSRGGDVSCPACTARAVLVDAAERSLETAIAPVLGAWAAHWAAAGVSVGELVSVLDLLSGADYNETYRARYVRGHLRRVMLAHRAPVFEVARPDRFEYLAADLPTLSAYHWADMTHPRDGHSWPYFTDGEGKAHTLPLGYDALSVTLPDGDALLIFTGLGGQSRLTRQQGYRVPARLLPQVRASLAGQDRA